MKIKDENGIVYEDKIINKLLKLLGLYDDEEKEYITYIYDPISGKKFISSKEIIEKATRKINQELELQG